MPHRFEMLVFDWDGTLMDSAAAIAESLQAACRALQLPVPSDEDARYIIGLGLADAMRHVLPGLPEADFPRVVERYRLEFLRRDGGTTLFTGMAEMVRELHSEGFLLGVATGKSRRGLDRALNDTGLTAYFHVTRCADEGFAKPHPGMLEAVLDSHGVSRDKALMIGDTTHDLEMARAANVAGVGVSYGAHERPALALLSPVALLDSPLELRAWLVANA